MGCGVDCGTSGDARRQPPLTHLTAHLSTSGAKGCTVRGVEKIRNIAIPPALRVNPRMRGFTRMPPRAARMAPPVDHPCRHGAGRPRPAVDRTLAGPRRTSAACVRGVDTGTRASWNAQRRPAAEQNRPPARMPREKVDRFRSRDAVVSFPSRDGKLHRASGRGAGAAGAPSVAAGRPAGGGSRVDTGFRGAAPLPSSSQAARGTSRDAELRQSLGT